jgi:hypothetical protein
MFMLKYGTQNEKRTNLNFDMKSLTRASGLLLGTSKTKEYLRANTIKSLLSWIGELEESAQTVLKNRSAEFPKDLESKASKEALETERADLARTIFGLRNLGSTIESSELEGLIRIRSKNQYKAINTTEVESIKGKDGATEVVIRVSQKDLPKFIAEAEKTGFSSLEITVDADDEDYTKAQLKKADVLFIFRDELTQRPEAKRIAQGNKLKPILRDARGSKRTPREVSNELSGQFTGGTVQLGRGAKITDISEKERKGSKVTWKISALLPEVKEAINKDPLGIAGQGAITDRQLKQHCSNEYGCNGRHFVAAAGEIAGHLNKNLEDATKKWFNKESISNDDIQTFLEEYYTLTVCLDRDLKSINSLEPTRNIIKGVSELIPSKGLDDASNHPSAETSYSVNAIGEQKLNMPVSSSIAAGTQWLKSLKQDQIEQSINTPQAKEYNANLEKVFSIQNIEHKIKLIEENYYRIPDDPSQIDSLDGGPEKIFMVAHNLSNELMERYEETMEKQEAEMFNSKSEEPKDYEGVTKIVIDDKEIGATRTINTPARKKEIIDKAEFIKQQKPIALSLPNRGEVIRRLAKYPHRASGLDFDRSDAEKYDNEISLSPKPRRASPRKPDGDSIKIEDCLTLEGIEDLKSKSKEGNYFKEIGKIKDLLDNWQSNKLITPNSKSPLDRNLYRWLSQVALNREEEKAKSLEELSRIFNSAVSNAGKLPYETERGVERFATPLRSSPLPLMLLCGIGYDKLAKTKNGEIELRVDGRETEDPAKAFDLTLRWTNAENLHRMPLKDTEENYINDLEEIIKEDDNDKLLEHCTLVESSNIPNFLDNYLESIGTTRNLPEIDEENSHYKELIAPLSSSPIMMRLGGEEAPIDGLVDLLSKEGIDISLNEQEQERVDLAAELALDSWRKTLGRTISKLESFLAPIKKDIKMELFLTTPSLDIPEEDDPFEKAITELHEFVPQSADDLRSVTTNLLAYNAQNITLKTQYGEIILTRGSNNTWTTKSTATGAKEALDVVNNAQGLIDSTERGPEDGLFLAECQKDAERVILFENIEKLSPAMDSLPQTIKFKTNIREIKEPINILGTQLEKAKLASKYGNQLLDAMADETPNPDNPWGHGQAVLNPRGSINFLCNKITQEDRAYFDQAGERIPEEKTSSYFSRQLITQENKEQAIEVLKKSGTKAAANYLKEELAKNTDAIIDQAAQTLPGMVKEIRSMMSQLLEHSYTDKAKEALDKNTPISKIISEKQRGRILEKKINDEISQIRGTAKDSRGLIDKLVSQRASKNKVTISSNNTGLKTDKLWVKEWLSSKNGRLNLSQRFNTACWVKSLREKSNAKTAIAFLEFCHHRGLDNIPKAIKEGALNKDETNAISKQLENFKSALDRLGVPEDSNLKVKLVAAFNLHTTTDRKKYSKLWDPNNDVALQAIKPKGETKLLDKEVELDLAITGGKSTPSPYLQQGIERGGIDPESDLDNADPKTRLRTVKRAISTLYQALPLDIYKQAPKQKRVERVEKQEVTI